MKLTIREVAAIKRNAQNVAAYIARKNKIAEKVAELKKEYDAICSTIEGFEAGTRAMTGGRFVSEDLVVKVVEGTGKQDANGKEIKITKYVPREGVLVLDEDGKAYTIAEQTNLAIDENAEAEFIPNAGFDPSNI